ncbi:MAG TPA: polynucleotide adenylyltransferase PcnB [Gammaproteobacteria bacterium]
MLYIPIDNILSNQATIIPRPEHNISRASVNANALKVLYRLHQAGYGSFLVGGCVRDILLGRYPKDFDVATEAHPETVKKLFDNCRLIGRRFRLAHVIYGRDIIEVATFRGYAEAGAAHADPKNGRILSDNVYGSIEQDVWRRDFTVNALYYNIADFSLIDYTGGLADLRKGVIRLIGEPMQRYREDPVRMLRALRFATKLGFAIEPGTAEPIYTLGRLLAEVPPARLFDETLKLFHTGHAVASFRMLQQYDLLKYLFPALAQALSAGSYPYALEFVQQALASTDLRIQQEKSVTPAFLFAALLWPPLLNGVGYHPDNLAGPMEMQKASGLLLARQCRHITIPRRLSAVMREIWLLQPRLQRNTGKRALALLSHPRFRAAYDFLCLRAQAGEKVKDSADWWTAIQQKNPEERLQMVNAVASGPRRRRHRPRMRRSGKQHAQSSG